MVCKRLLQNFRNVVFVVTYFLHWLDEFWNGQLFHAKLCRYWHIHLFKSRCEVYDKCLKKQAKNQRKEAGNVASLGQEVQIQSVRMTNVNIVS